jgi:hypothetical protein
MKKLRKTHPKISLRVLTVIMNLTEDIKSILRIPPVKRFRVKVMVFNATFKNISAISWQSVLLVEETGVPKENHRPATSK